MADYLLVLASLSCCSQSLSRVPCSRAALWCCRVSATWRAVLASNSTGSGCAGCQTAPFRHVPGVLLHPEDEEPERDVPSLDVPSVPPGQSPLSPVSCLSISPQSPVELLCLLGLSLVQATPVVERTEGPETHGGGEGEPSKGSLVRGA